MEAPKLPAHVSRVQRLSHLLDDAFEIPGTSWRIGIDPLIGLIPGFGDVIMTLLSLYIAAEALAARTALPVIFRMLLNILIEFAFGSVPIVGDLFDFAWKANSRNARLLESYTQQPDVVRKTSGWVIAGAALGCLMVLTLISVLFGILIFYTVRFLHLALTSTPGV